jgi:hypothetical protein
MNDAAIGSAGQGGSHQETDWRYGDPRGNWRKSGG